jgi:hypothetical protein
MKKIITYLSTHIRSDFNLLLYLAVACLLAITVTFNYIYDFEDSIIDAYYGQEIRFLWYFLFYAFAYYSTVMIISLVKRNTLILTNKLFWLYSLVAIAIMSFDGGFHYHYTYTHEGNFPAELSDYAFRCLSNLNSLLTIFLPLFLFYKYKDTQQNGFYGLSAKASDLKPYAWMLLIMLPLITWASFQPDFLDSYPSYKDSGADEFLHLPQWATALFFELAYGLDFIATELLFRGFLVIGMVHILGKDAILPMVVTYAFLHFGKPLGETIGSVFGGYILGIVALYSRNIWGGVAIHLGVAWLMELTAFMQLLRQ